MKKFLSLCAVATVCSFAASAENPVQMRASGENSGKQTMNKEQRMDMRKEVNQEVNQKMHDKKMAEASPEQKQRMQQHHEMMEKLTPEQKEAFKKEMERHRQAMKQITGVDFVGMHEQRRQENQADRKEFRKEAVDDYRQEHGFEKRPMNNKEGAMENGVGNKMPEKGMGQKDRMMERKEKMQERKAVKDSAAPAASSVNAQ
jgi:hypothetical protein